MATASICTSTSARPGTGTGLVPSVSSPGEPRIHARISSGTGTSGDVLTPDGAYIGSSQYCCVPLAAERFVLLAECKRRKVRKSTLTGQENGGRARAASQIGKARQALPNAGFASL